VTAWDLLDIALKLGVVLFLVALNGFFVAAEFALVKIRETQLAPLVDKGHKRAIIARRILGNLDAALSATQLGITLASLGLGWVGEPIFANLLEPLLQWLNVDSEKMRHSISFAIGFTTITFLHIVVGELAPKSMAIQKPLNVSLWVALPMELFYKVSYPFIWVLNNAALWMLRKVGVEPAGEGESSHSREELRLLVNHSQHRVGSGNLGRDIILNALDLSQRQARDVMRPRREIVGLDTRQSIESSLEVAEKTRYSRFPLCENGDLDRTPGVVHFKDLYAQRGKAVKAVELKYIARKLIYVPPTCRLERLLQLFLERKLHFALVVDEFGGTIGMVTLENILEELVGQIQDEFDQEAPLLQPVGAGEWILMGELPLHDLAELVGEEIPDEEISTASGFVTHRLGGFPKKGDELVVGGFRVTILQTDGAKVVRLRLKKDLPPEPPAPEI